MRQFTLLFLVFLFSSQSFAQRPSAEGWVNIETFRDDESAVRFWQKARKAQPGKTAGFKIRIARVMTRMGGAVLFVGPFSGFSEATEFCQKAIAAVDSTLGCGFTDIEPNNIRTVSLDSELQRTKPVQDNQPAKIKPLLEASSPTTAFEGGYWALIGTAEARSQAEQIWINLKEKQSEALQNTAGGVIPPEGGAMLYKVLAGPFISADSASSLCIRLIAKGVRCHVENR